MLGTDDVGEKIENATITIICYLDVIMKQCNKEEVPN